MRAIKFSNDIFANCKLEINRCISFLSFLKSKIKKFRLKNSWRFPRIENIPSFSIEIVMIFERRKRSILNLQRYFVKYRPWPHRLVKSSTCDEEQNLEEKDRFACVQFFTRAPDPIDASRIDSRGMDPLFVRTACLYFEFQTSAPRLHRAIPSIPKPISRTFVSNLIFLLSSRDKLPALIERLANELL